jgi:hypothetical protein
MARCVVLLVIVLRCWELLALCSNEFQRLWLTVMMFCLKIWKYKTQKEWSNWKITAMTAASKAERKNQVRDGQIQVEKSCKLREVQPEASHWRSRPGDEVPALTHRRTDSWSSGVQAIRGKWSRTSRQRVWFPRRTSLRVSELEPDMMRVQSMQWNKDVSSAFGERTHCPNCLLLVENLPQLICPHPHPSAKSLALAALSSIRL